MRGVKCGAIERLLLSRLLDKRRLHRFEPLLLKTPKIGKGLLNTQAERGARSEERGASRLCAGSLWHMQNTAVVAHAEPCTHLLLLHRLTQLVTKVSNLVILVVLARIALDSLGARIPSHLAPLLFPWTTERQSLCTAEALMHSACFKR